MNRNEEVKQRILAWEKQHGRKMEELTDQEWIAAAQEVLALSSLEAEEMLEYLQAKALEVQQEKQNRK